MDNAGYVALTRQTGLMKEMQMVANNIANLSTSGFRREGLIFAEHVKEGFAEGGSISMTTARGRITDFEEASIAKTGGRFDFAIEGEGFFALETPAGVRLTRAGSFTPNANGELVNPDGYLVLDAAEAPIFIPPDAGEFSVAGDGTVTANGQPVAQIGVFEVENTDGLIREDGVRFRTDDPLLPAQDGQVLQGHLEDSNVNPVAEIARMIQVQRAYEAGQSFLEREDQRIRNVIRAAGQ